MAPLRIQVPLHILIIDPVELRADDLEQQAIEMARHTNQPPPKVFRAATFKRAKELCGVPYDWVVVSSMPPPPADSPQETLPKWAEWMALRKVEKHKPIPPRILVYSYSQLPTAEREFRAAAFALLEADPTIEVYRKPFSTQMWREIHGDKIVLPSCG